MTKTLCERCAKEYRVKGFTLLTLIRGTVKATCECCGQTQKCKIYTMTRENNK